MKHKFLASLLALSMLLGLLPGAALAAENDEDGEEPVVCAGHEADETCAAETHVEGCPLYVAPDPEEIDSNNFYEPENVTDDEGSIMPLGVDGDDAAEQDTEENSWDVSANGDEGKVTARLTQNDDNSTYTLIISGSGAMEDFSSADAVPWKDYRDTINTVVIESGVTSIGAFAFIKCASLTSVSMPDSVTSIGNAAFNSCEKLAELTIGKGVTTINAWAFNNMYGLEKFSVADGNETFIVDDDGVLYKKVSDDESTTLTLQASPKANTGTYTVPESIDDMDVTAIETAAFAHCGWSSVVISNNVKTMGTYVFVSNLNLTSVTLSNQITSIGSAMFNGDTKLSSITFPDSVTSIGNTAFSSCWSLTEIDTNRVTSIGGQAFQKCSGLTSVTIGENVTIANSAFDSCTQLQNLTLGESCKIGQSFTNCTSLTSVEIPAKTEVGYYAFYNCTNLKEVVFNGQVAPASNFPTSDSDNLIKLNQSGFASCTSLVKAEFKSGTKNAGKQGQNGTTYENHLILCIQKDSSAEWYTANGTIYTRWNYNCTSDPCELTDNAVIYAVYSSTIEFDANGGEGTVNDVTSYYAPGLADEDAITISGKPCTLPSDGFTRKGYTLSGWNTEADGTGTSYELGAAVNVTNQEIKTLYAQWTPNNYTIVFNGGTEASGTTNNVSATYDQPATLTANGFTKSGYNFAGWATDASATTAAYSDGATVENLTDEANGSVTLYAVWTDKQVLTPDKSVQTKTYNGEAQAFTLEGGYTIAHQQNGAAVTAPTNAGSYDVVISHAGDDTYAPYPATMIPGGLVIIPATLPAPKLTTYTATATSIIVTAPTTFPTGASEVQYSIDNGENWQDSGEFSGLKAGTSYSVIAKFVAANSGNYTDSANSESLTVQTSAAPNDTPNTPSNGGGSHSSSSSSSSSSTYPVTVDSDKNGTVSVSPKNARKDATVTLTVKANSGYELDDLTVTDKNGKNIKVTEGKNGKFTFTMPAGKVTVEASFTKVEEQPKASFADVPANAYYADAVAWAVENGVTSGTSADTFSPNAACTRAQAVTFLWRAAGSPAPKNSANPFADVPASAYYYDAVLWAVEQGITSGTSADTFSPDATCTRGQIVTFLYRADGTAVNGGNPFADVADSAYYAAPVKWAVAEGVTSGTSATTFSPDASCTRAQIVTFLYRAYAD